GKSEWGFKSPLSHSFDSLSLLSVTPSRLRAGGSSLRLAQSGLQRASRTSGDANELHGLLLDLPDPNQPSTAAAPANTQCYAYAPDSRAGAQKKEQSHRAGASPGDDGVSRLPAGSLHRYRGFRRSAARDPVDRSRTPDRPHTAHTGRSGAGDRANRPRLDRSSVGSHGVRPTLRDVRWNDAGAGGEPDRDGAACGVGPARSADRRVPRRLDLTRGRNQAGEEHEDRRPDADHGGHRGQGDGSGAQLRRDDSAQEGLGTCARPGVRQNDDRRALDARLPDRSRGSQGARLAGFDRHARRGLRAHAIVPTGRGAPPRRAIRAATLRGATGTP